MSNAVRNEPSLISCYTFDDGTANDSLASNRGTAAGVVNYDQGVGRGTDRALVFRGSGHINLGAVDAFDFADGSYTEAIGTARTYFRVKR